MKTQLTWRKEYLGRRMGLKYTYSTHTITHCYMISCPVVLQSCDGVFCNPAIIERSTHKGQTITSAVVTEVL